MARILIVDDYPDFARLLVNVLSIDGHECRAAVAADEALRVAREFAPDLLLIDWTLRGATGDGLAVARALHAECPAARIAVMSGSPAAAVRAELAGMPVSAVLEKPFNALQVVRSLLAT